MCTNGSKAKLWNPFFVFILCLVLKIWHEKHISLKFYCRENSLFIDKFKDINIEFFDIEKTLNEKEVLIMNFVKIIREFDKVKLSTKIAIIIFSITLILLKK